MDIVVKIVVCVYVVSVTLITLFIAGCRFSKKFHDAMIADMP